MEKHKIGVISDTHGLLRPEISDILKSCEYILHGGDIGNIEVVSKLKEINTVYAVRGNVDNSLPANIPEELDLELFGFKIYIIHNKKYIKSDLKDKDIVIYGHSHKHSETKYNNAVFLNPGSCGPRRFRLPVTMLILTLYPEEHRFETKKIDLTSLISDKKISKVIPRQDMDKLIKTVVKEIKSGIPAEKIAAKNHIDNALVEQICRIYFTHPGINTDGILKRMEIQNL